MKAVLLILLLRPRTWWSCHARNPEILCMKLSFPYNTFESIGYIAMVLDHAIMTNLGAATFSAPRSTHRSELDESP
jgi:hypothetical protein